ncbi:hypothetical protein A9Q96_06045 [Rhodobacterales bacterium 52_120_T64]|nr:hypothetical protein A9Q96_06045 [Rhodobacterales bacterium 52_120_T64]
MFARITRYKMKDGSRDDATAIMEGLKEEIMSLPGMQQFINSMDEDGSGHIIAIVESRTTSEANALRIKELWGTFSDLLERAPEMVGHDIVANWSN